MQWDNLLVRKRFYSAGTNFDESGRSGFQRDIDRIVFSAAFRRLQGKTQVHPLPKNDHIHNRLTHSLEVACIGRTLGTRIGLYLQEKKLLPNDFDPNLIGQITQAACTTHDIGNPPFGHACEESIGDWFEKWFVDQPKISELLTDNQKHDLISFDGNAQGFRILTRTEYFFNEGGMRLSFPVLAAFLKYPWLTTSAPNKGKRKASCFLSEKDFLREVCSTVGLIEIRPDRWCRHPLAYLVEAADDICYKVIDVEDGIELGIINFDEYDKILGSIGELDHGLDKKPPPGVARRLFFQLRGRIFDRLIDSTVSIFTKHYDEIMEGKFEGDLFSRSPSATANLLKAASDTCRQKVFTDRKKTIIEIGVSENINITLGTFSNAIAEHVLGKGKREQLSPVSRKVVDHVESEGFNMPNNLYDCLRGVVDYVSGMTDNYATYVARQIGGMVV